MKCPKCRKDSTKKERAGGKCPACGWEFRFDPPEPLSDFEVEHAVQAVSRGGAHRYTRAQLIAEVERVLVKRATRIYEGEAAAILESTSSPFVWLFALGLAVAGLVLLGIFQERCGTPLIALSVLVLIFRLFRRDPALVAAEVRARIQPYDPRAAGIVDRYLGRDVPGLLVEPPDVGPSREDSARAPHREFDLESYGFDRVIVVQGDENVDMLVKNQFHFQHNAAIVSFTGYPKHVASLVRRQLAENAAQAHVFLLHDADGEGARLASNWRTSSGAPAERVHDVGLTAQHAARLLPRRPLGSGGVTTAEATDGGDAPDYRVELAALRPEQMMTLLFNAMSAVDRGSSSATPAIAVGDDFDHASDGAYDFG